MCGRYSLGFAAQDLGTRTRAADLVVDDIRGGRQATINYNMCPGRYGAIYRQTSPEEEAHPGDDASKANSNLHETGDPSSETTEFNKDDGTSKPKRVLEFFKWGLIPAYASDQKMTYKTFNCRIENLQGKSTGLWAKVKQHKRCLVPADGYFEWQIDTKDPYFVTTKDHSSLFFAGLWEVNYHEKEPLWSFTIITQPASKSMAWLHNRMPVMIDVKSSFLDKWLDPSYAWNDQLAVDIGNATIDHEAVLNIYQVGRDVGKVENNYPELTLPVKKRPAEVQMSPSKKAKSSKGNMKITSFFQAAAVSPSAKKEKEGYGGESVQRVKDDKKPLIMESKQANSDDEQTRSNKDTKTHDHHGKKADEDEHNIKNEEADRIS